MLTISKVFSIFRSLCLCRNEEYPVNFQNKSVKSSFKRVPKYIWFQAKLKEKARPFWSGKVLIYPLKYLLQVG